MSRTNIDIDEKAVAAIMRRYGFGTRREAVNYALRAVATDPLSVSAARKLRGSGWSGDLDTLRSDRAP
jgi:Arc/MetJ family transcription regulator